MKWVLVLYFMGGLSASPAGVAIGPYDDRPSCDIAGQLASRDGWRPFCYPIGKLELKKPEAEAPKKQEQPQ